MIGQSGDWWAWGVGSAGGGNSNNNNFFIVSDREGRYLLMLYFRSLLISTLKYGYKITWSSWGWNPKMDLSLPYLGIYLLAPPSR